MKQYLKKVISIVSTFPIILSNIGSLQQAYCQDFGISSNINSIGISENNSDSNQLFGFSLIKTLIKRDDNPILIYEHEKSGAKVCIEKNNNPDKIFNICFRTPLENNKGTNHVIEHCILEGSKEYPLKNMFVELGQLSYRTFMNASTSRDYTYFPISSLDEDELNSLAHVYIDCVFHPEFIKNEKIFKKEGIRYGLGASGELTVNGTVFNEMSGILSNIWHSLHDKISRDLFCDTQERFQHGGVPTDIMDLTYDEICTTYQKYYHPSNCMFYMSGNINYARFLEWIDKEYLSEYDRRDISSIKYDLQNPTGENSFNIHEYFSDEKDESFSYATASYILDDSEYINSGKWEQLCSILNDPNSPRVKYIKSKGYTNIVISFNKNSRCQPTLFIQLTSPKDRNDLITQNNIQESIDEFLFKNPILQNEVDLYEKNHKFNVDFSENNKIYDSHLDYNNLMMSFVRYNDPYSNKYFNFVNDESSDKPTSAPELNNLLTSSLSGKRQCISVFKPSSNKDLQVQEQVRKKLELKEVNKESLTKNYDKQDIWCNTPNAPEDIQKLKKMFKSLADIDVPKLQCSIGSSPMTIGQSENINDITQKPCYISEADLGEFGVFNIMFDINHISTDRLNYLRLFNNLFDEVNTDKYSKDSFKDEISDKISINYSILMNADTGSGTNTSFEIRPIINGKNIYKSFDLLKEQLLHTNYADTKNIEICIDNMINNLKIRNMQQQREGSFRSSHQNLISLYNIQYFPNMSYLTFLKNIKQNINNKEFMDKLKLDLEAIRDSFINQNSFKSCCICSSPQLISPIKHEITNLLHEIPIGTSHSTLNLELNYPAPEKKIFIDPSMSNNSITQIINIGASCNDDGWKIFSKIVCDKYLKPEIREKNGAYTVNMDVNTDEGILTIFSSRDPNLLSTLKTFSSIPDFIDNLELTQANIDIHSKSSIPNVLPSRKTTLAINEMLMVIFKKEGYCESINKQVNQIKSMTPEKLKSYANILRNNMDKSTISILAGKISPEERQSLTNMGFEINE